ncbi:hypothetical protein CRE_04420 [Caenorhabditis remanei]|uniref:Uncharacterized protein n=1 Tax=Caenorhabditis remanei TaxID=31234 RepID=E3NNT5_CAERE|nr:hypothetical protein CRE_04420 [Caenorhabditis remanei]
MLPHIRHGADNHRRQRPLQMQRQHPAPRIENVFIQDYTVEQYFQSYQLPFTIEDIDRFAMLEQDWPLDELPDDVEDRGGLRLAVWRETRPTPHTHWEQIALRLPIITNVPGAREYFVKNARVQNELREGATTSRCPECGSQLGGFPVPDHSCKVCPFSPLKNMDRLEFMASNLIAYCNACNSRSASHNECKRNVCRRCEDSNHTLAQDLCNWHIGTNAGFQEQLDNVEQRRIERLELIDRLIHQPTQPLRYFSYLDEPPFNAIRRIRPGSDIYGWGPLLDYPARFDQPVNRNIYGNSLEGKKTEYPSLVPPEYDNNPQVPIPRFSEADREYLNRVADAVTALRENYEAYHHIEVPQLPPRGGRPDEEHQRADDGHQAPMPQVEPAPPQRPLRLQEAAPQHAQLPGPPPVEIPPPKLVWEDGTIIVLEPVVNQATEPRAQHGRIDGANQRPRALPEQRPIQVRQANRPLPPPVEARRQITPVVNVAEQVPIAPIVPPVERSSPTDRPPSTNGNTTQVKLYT